MIESAEVEAQLRCWRCLQWVVMLALFFAAVPAQATGTVEPSLYAAPCPGEVQRAGMPWRHLPWARQQRECDYGGYYVGGGAPGGCSRRQCNHEGTWGWDYAGHHFKRRVKLSWSWLERKQGGTGQYQPDGPRVAESIKHHLEKE